LSQEQVQRSKVIENAVAGRIRVREAAEYLNLRERQVKRLKRTHDEGDSSWVQHGNQGRSPSNALLAKTRQRVEEFARVKYAGLNDSHLHEKLTGSEGLVLSRPSVQRILREAGISSPQKRRPQKYRSRRNGGSRRACFYRWMFFRLASEQTEVPGLYRWRRPPDQTASDPDRALPARHAASLHRGLPRDKRRSRSNPSYLARRTK